MVSKGCVRIPPIPRGRYDLLYIFKEFDSTAEMEKSIIRFFYVIFIELLNGDIPIYLLNFVNGGSFKLESEYQKILS